MGGIARALINIENLFLVFAGPASGAKSCKDWANALSSEIMCGFSQLQEGKDTHLTEVRSHHRLSEMRETKTSWLSALLFYT